MSSNKKPQANPNIKEKANPNPKSKPSPNLTPNKELKLNLS